MKQTIIISGAKGFLGRNLIHLLKDDYTLYGIGRQAEITTDIQIFASDAIDAIELIPDFLIVCHAAVASGNTNVAAHELFNINVALTEQLVKKFSSSKIIYISSVSVYDPVTEVIYENSLLNPQSEYAISKLWAERIVSRNSNSVIIRLSSLFGPGMKENTIIPNYTNQALQNGIIEIWGKGLRMQNYISVTDACQFISKTIKAFDKVVDQVLLGVSVAEHSNADLASVIAEYTNSKIIYINQDKSQSLHYNNSSTCSSLEWAPNSDFTSAIQNYIQWKRKQF